MSGYDLPNAWCNSTVLEIISFTTPRVSEKRQGAETMFAISLCLAGLVEVEIWRRYVRRGVHWGRAKASN